MEYLDFELPIKELVVLVHQSVFASGLFEESAIKTRARAYSHYQTGVTDTPFIHITLKILQGRNHQQKKELIDLVINRLRESLTSPITLSVDVVDINKVSYKKLEI